MPRPVSIDHTAMVDNWLGRGCDRYCDAKCTQWHSFLIDNKLFGLFPYKSQSLHCIRFFSWTNTSKRACSRLVTLKGTIKSLTNTRSPNYTLLLSTLRNKTNTALLTGSRHKKHKLSPCGLICFLMKQFHVSLHCNLSRPSRLTLYYNDHQAICFVPLLGLAACLKQDMFIHVNNRAHYFTPTRMSLKYEN